MAYKDIKNRKAASKRHYYANKERYLERNKRYRFEISTFVNNLKTNATCPDCHINYPYYVMDFDHLEGTEKLGIVSYFAKTGRIGALKKEIIKCDIVCANCHRERTHRRLQEVKRDSILISTRSSAG